MNSLATMAKDTSHNNLSLLVLVGASTNKVFHFRKMFAAFSCAIHHNLDFFLPVIPGAYIGARPGERLGISVNAIAKSIKPHRHAVIKCMAALLSPDLFWAATFMPREDG